MAGREVVALAGGVGGAKLALGLAHVLPAEHLTVAVNTADDFEHWGLYICPDLDTVTYTLAGVANPETGWGLKDETWNVLAAMEKVGGETWFRLGDKDLAKHLERTRRLKAGESLTSIMADLARRLGTNTRIVPMSDQPVRTMVTTPNGELAFQDWFVRRRCEPVVTSVRFAGVEQARPHKVLADFAGTRAVIVCPSNPFVSVAPILALPGVRSALQNARCPRIAVTPIVGGQAIKGPAAKMLAELGHDVSALGVARFYTGLVDGFVLDALDSKLGPQIEALGMRVLITDTMMRNDADKERLAAATLEFADRIGVHS